jgi:molecular chaperone GrpE
MTDEPIISNDQPVSEPESAEKEKYLRLAADFDNYRRRMEQEMLEVAKFGSSQVIKSVIEPFDLLEQAIAHAPPEVQEKKEWFSGLEQIGKQFQERMQKLGVERITVIGKHLDPATMEAIQIKPPDSPDQSGMVEQEVQAGYTLNGRVIRPAKVIVYQ